MKPISYFFLLLVCLALTYSCNNKDVANNKSYNYDPVTLVFDVVNGGGESLLAPETEGNWIGHSIYIVSISSDEYYQTTVGEDDPYNRPDLGFPRIEDINGQLCFVYGRFTTYTRFRVIWPDKTEDMIQIQFSVATQDDGTQKQQVRYFWGKDRKEVDGPYFRLVKQPIFE